MFTSAKVAMEGVTEMPTRVKLAELEVVRDCVQVVEILLEEALERMRGALVG